MAKKKSTDGPIEASSFERYLPTDREKEVIELVYKEHKIMRDVMTAKYPEFNDRTLAEFLDDCQKRANSYVPTREAQGKEEWQANIFVPYTRNKIKSYQASTSKAPPDLKIIARNKKNEVSAVRAEIMSALVRASYYAYGNNPELTIARDSWNGCVNGTIVTYDGFLKTKGIVKEVTSFDQVTGKVEFTEKEGIIENCSIEKNVPIKNFYIKNAYVSDVQKQDAIMEVELYTPERFDAEFGHYPNAKWVKTGAQVLDAGETQTFFGEHWMDRVEKNMIEVNKYYTKHGDKKRDLYAIISSGVCLLDSPLLWGNRRKKFPYGKSGFEMFANTEFFWLNSVCNILMPSQDIANSFTNSMVDKTNRSLTTPLLIGAVNKDQFDIEDEYVNQDNKIYVDDINQVKPMPVDAVSASEFNMLKMVVNGIEESSVDSVQGGQAGSGSTAREVVIANERAEQLKNVYFMFLKDLWMQKYAIRILNILMNYGEEQIDESLPPEDASEYKKFRAFTVNNHKLKNGKMGNLLIEVAPKSQHIKPSQLSVRENAYAAQGVPTEIIQIEPNALDTWDYEFDIVTDTLYDHNKSLDMALSDEKITKASTLFPQIFMSAQDEFFKEFMEGYGDNPEKYLQAANQQQSQQPGMPPGGQPAGTGQPPAMHNIMPKV